MKDKKKSLIVLGTLLGLGGITIGTCSVLEDLLSRNYHPDYAQRIGQEHISPLIRLEDKVDSVVYQTQKNNADALGKEDGRYAELGYSNELMGPKRLVLDFKEELGDLTFYVGPTGSEKVRLNPLGVWSDGKNLGIRSLGLIEIPPHSPSSVYSIIANKKTKTIYLDNLGPGTVLIDAVKNE